MALVTPTDYSHEIFGTWLFSYHWTSLNLTYSFPVAAEDYGYVGRTPIAELLPDQVSAVERAMAEISGFTQLTFEKSGEAGDGVLRFSRDTGETGAYAYLPNGEDSGGDSFYGRNTAGAQIGNEANLYFLHELGHALGLEHGHQSVTFAKSAYNSQEFTLMTYTDYVGDTNLHEYASGAVDWAQSYQQLDIAALQYLYGANYSARGEVWSGRSVYTFDPLTGEMSINGEGQGTPAGNRIFRTIWDGHGKDTYDLSNYDNGVQIDLRPGAWSTFSQGQLADLNRFGDGPNMTARGNVANALLVDGDNRSLIENAIGGAGEDSIMGNRAANRLSGLDGDDWINGGAGNDVLLGGRGNDTLIGGRGDDILRGGAGRDTLQGGGGADQLYGGAGADCFVFDLRSGDGSEAGVSRIMDFVSGLDTIQIIAEVAALELRIDRFFSPDGPSVSTRVVGEHTRVRVDFDGDRQADLVFKVMGVDHLVDADFLF